MSDITSFAPYDFEDGYPAMKGLSQFFVPLFNGAAEGTGIIRIVRFTKNITGDKIPKVFLDYAVGIQNALFGGYPDESDIAPSVVFAALFGVVALIHLFIFFVNYSRGHYFWISLIWGINALGKLVGFALRAAWGTDVTMIPVGLTSEFFLLIPFVITVSFDLILAQRLFTWRHPVGGSRKLFWSIMLTMYAIVLLLVVVTVLASFAPYLDFLSAKAWQSYKVANMVTGVFVVLYSLFAMILIALSYLFPPTAKDENLYTYQPWWIESFSPFYFVQPGAAQQAEETFMKRNHNHRHAIRVIAATHHHYNMVEGLTNQRGNLKHNISMGLICITSLLIFVGSVGRLVVLFQNRIQRNASEAANKVFMYICWGAFEWIINVLYIVGRVDLRFYRPDILPAKVRSIVTAEQSYYPSDNEDLTPDSGSLVSSESKATPSRPQSPPYPKDDFFKEKPEVDDDNLSDFHF